MSTTPVFIIGAGPVGLCLAAALVKRGVNVEIFEALPEPNPQARAMTFHPPTLEIFERLGILESALAKGEIVNELQYWKRNPQELVAAFSLDMLADFTPYPYRLHLPQHEVVTLLAQIIENSGFGKIHFNHRLQLFENHGDSIEATFITPDGGVTKTCRYLCATDGGRSFVRRHLRIPFEGATLADRFLIADSDADLERYLPQAGKVMFIFDPDEWVIAQRFRNRTRFTFRLRLEEDAEMERTPRLVYKRVERFIPSISHNIKNIRVYAVQQRVAHRFREGRIALAGDAAHVTNPVGGTGLNAGIHDTALLARTLYDVLNGHPDTLLDTYDEQRRQIALNFVNPIAEDDYADMAATSHHEMAKRDARFQEIVTNFTLSQQFVMRASMMEDRIPSD